MRSMFGRTVAKGSLICVMTSTGWMARTASKALLESQISGYFNTNIDFRLKIHISVEEYFFLWKFFQNFLIFYEMI